jgi:hypothetical protein
MSRKNVLRELSPWRKGALTFAVFGCLGTLATAWFLASHPAVAWPMPVVIAWVGLSAFACSIVFVEMARGLVPGYSGWPDAKHFRVVFVVCVALFPVQLIGVLIALSARGGHAL